MSLECICYSWRLIGRDWPTTPNSPWCRGCWSRCLGIHSGMGPPSVASQTTPKRPQTLSCCSRHWLSDWVCSCCFQRSTGGYLDSPRMQCSWTSLAWTRRSRSSSSSGEVVLSSVVSFNNIYYYYCCYSILLLSNLAEFQPCRPKARKNPQHCNEDLPGLLLTLELLQYDRIQVRIEFIELFALVQHPQLSLDVSEFAVYG